MRQLPARAEALEARTLLTAWYVSAAAGTAGDGSPASPFRTIQQAANVANAGDAVLIAPGTYNERVRVTRPGTAAAPITFRRDGAGAVTVVPTAGVPMWDGAVTIAASNITFDGVDVRDSTWYGYNIEGTTAAPLANVTVRNAHTLNTYASGVFAGRTTAVSILNCRIQNACVSPNPAHNVHECITVGETDGFLIAGNEVWNSGVAGVANGGEGIDAKGSSKNGVIRDNRVHDLARLGIYLDAGSKQRTAATDANPMSNIIVTGNVVRNAAGGIVIASELGGLARDLAVTNNLVHDCREDGIALVAWAAERHPDRQQHRLPQRVREQRADMGRRDQPPITDGFAESAVVNTHLNNVTDGSLLDNSFLGFAAETGTTGIPVGGDDLFLGTFWLGTPPNVPGSYAVNIVSAELLDASVAVIPVQTGGTTVSAVVPEPAARAVLTLPATAVYARRRRRRETTHR